MLWAKEDTSMFHELACSHCGTTAVLAQACGLKHYFRTRPVIQEFAIMNSTVRFPDSIVLFAGRLSQQLAHSSPKYGLVMAGAGGFQEKTHQEL